MDLRVTDTAVLDWTGDGLAIGLFESDGALTGDWAALDEKLSGVLKD
jgi:leucyl aminopeptidase